MSMQATPIADTTQDLELSERLLAPDGTRQKNPELDPFVADVDAAQLRALHRDMVILRRIDAEGVALQRQGQLGLWAPCNGQEAAQIGTARALDPIDFVFPSYRETGVIYARGAQPGDFVRVWRGASVSHDVRAFAPQIDVPTLLVAAQKDDITPIEAERHLATLFPDAELVEIADVGHLIHYETPADAAGAIRRFLRVPVARGR